MTSFTSGAPGVESGHDNPILAAFREYAALDNFGHVSHLIVHEVREHLAGRQFTYEACELIDNAWAASSQEQLVHARCVIDLLWQLTYPDDGYEEPAPEENFWDDRTTPLAYSEGDSKRDTMARSKDIAMQLLPDRYRLLASDDEVKQDLELRCTDCGTHLCDAQHDDTLWVLASVAIEHEVQAHW